MLLAGAAYCAAGCAASLGPGYTIVKQQITVQFVPAPQPVIRIEGVYQLKNTGNQPLTSLELRLPGRRRFHFSDPSAQWDKTTLTLAAVPDNPRNALLTFPQRWRVSSQHTLRLSGEYQRPGSDETALSFTPDAFFLPAQGWSPELLPERGILATGGGNESVNLWTRRPQNPEALRQPSEALVRTIQAYDSTFGARPKDSHRLWIVECPDVAGCFASTTSNFFRLISEENEKTSAEMASQDTAMVDLSGGAPQIAAAAPPLAASWLGYGQNPGFFEQTPPLSALPAFAASRGREAVEGPQVRAQIVRRLLRAIPTNPQPRQLEADDALRAKSLLFFYALQDRYGQQVFSAALSHMLDARRGGGFDLDDLIAAFEQETHQNVAQFVRLWMKNPGVPEDFRARYENTAASALTLKETLP